MENRATLHFFEPKRRETTIINWSLAIINHDGWPLTSAGSQPLISLVHRPVSNLMVDTPTSSSRGWVRKSASNCPVPVCSLGFGTFVGHPMFLWMGWTIPKNDSRNTVKSWWLVKTIPTCVSMLFVLHGFTIDFRVTHGHYPSIYTIPMAPAYHDYRRQISKVPSGMVYRSLWCVSSLVISLTAWAGVLAVSCQAGHECMIYNDQMCELRGVLTTMKSLRVGPHCDFQKNMLRSLCWLKLVFPKGAHRQRMYGNGKWPYLKVLIMSQNPRESLKLNSCQLLWLVE